MSEYPKARWSPGDTSTGASVWTRAVPEGGGGGYYLYRWQRGSDVITLEELVTGTTQQERARGERSVYALLTSIPVPDAVREADARGQEVGTARLMYADMTERFGVPSSWIPYDGYGKPVWFHEEITQGSGRA